MSNQQDEDNDDPLSEAIKRGEFDNLAGMGKPLRLEQDRMVPEEYRLAYRIMRDNNVEPEWIQLTREIDNRIATARVKLRQIAKRFHDIQARYGGKPGLEAVTARLAAMDQRDTALSEFRQEIEQVNKQIRDLNLKVPVTHITRDLLDIQREIELAFSAS